MKKKLSKEEQQEALRLIAERDELQKTSQITKYFPATGPLRRELYPKHTKFFELGATIRQRLMLAANRIGKTESIGLYETVLHLTGRYPSWWKGYRFTKPIKVWICGKTATTARDILQQKLLGIDLRNPGTGLIAARRIETETFTKRHGVGDLLDSFTVLYGPDPQPGGPVSKVYLKSYEQGRSAFEGTEIDVILLDEEPPIEIYNECLIRTMTNQGLILATFTPLEGMSDTVMSFFPGGEIREYTSDTKAVVMATWDDVPHLSDSVKKELSEGLSPSELEARSKGIPAMGAGKIFQMAQADYIEEPQIFQPHWLYAFGMDVGWKNTGVIFGAFDKHDGCIHILSEHLGQDKTPTENVAAMRAVFPYEIYGVIDPAANGRSQHDGTRLIELYRSLGLTRLEFADNSVEAGIAKMVSLLSSGKLKIASTCTKLLAEMQVYQRTNKGKVHKTRDHLIDAMRYLVMSGEQMAYPIAGAINVETKVQNRKPWDDDFQYNYGVAGGGKYGWLG